MRRDTHDSRRREEETPYTDRSGQSLLLVTMQTVLSNASPALGDSKEPDCSLAPGFPKLQCEQKTQHPTGWRILWAAPTMHSDFSLECE